MAPVRKPQIAVIGAGTCSKKQKLVAEQVGRHIAEQGGILICGGLGGSMEAAARGAKEVGGTTIGIIPGVRKSDANDHIDFVISTGLGEARNLVVARSADAVIALPGRYGTLSEMAFALMAGVPVVSLGSWDLGDDVHKVDDALAAVELALELAARRL